VRVRQSASKFPDTKNQPTHIAAAAAREPRGRWEGRGAPSVDTRQLWPTHEATNKGATRCHAADER
jgi:hypothetical protein